jgi:hypothetical protein
MPRLTASWLLAGTCCACALAGRKTSDEPPPVIELPLLSESRTPIYDSLSPPDRDEADRVLRGCRDTGGGCSESLLQLETGAPVPMAIAEAVCGDGHMDVCARLLHLRGVARGTSRAEGLRLLDGACQRRLTEACLNLALALVDEPGPRHREDIRRLAHFACAQGLSAGCAIEEPAPPPPLLQRPDAGLPARALNSVPGHDPGVPDLGEPGSAPTLLPLGHDLTALLVPGQLLVLGAVFGTREAPEQLARVARASASQVGPTVVALDIEVEEATRLARFLHRPADAREIDAVLQGFWLRPYQDGRSSHAVLRMLLQLRGAIAQGLPITPIPIDVPLQGEPHTLALAKALEGLVRRNPSAVVITLLGNQQAALVSVTLRKRGVRLLAVHLAHDGGEAWTCMRRPTLDWQPNWRFHDAIDQLKELSCSEHPVPAAQGNDFFTDSLDTTLVRSRESGRALLYPGNFARDGFDFVFPLGAVTASRPVVPQTR